MLANDPNSILLASDSRSATAGADAVTRDTIELAEFWSLLLSGRAKLTGGFCDEQRHFLTFRYSSESSCGLAERRVRYLERCLLGEQQKRVAADLRLSPATIAGGMAGCFREMGIAASGSRGPMLLVVAAHAGRGEGSIRTARLSAVPGKPEQTVSIPRPDAALAPRLSHAEFRIARLLAEGWTYAEIARHRGSSVRTIANQVTSIFHKLGLSGRSELLHYIVLAYDSGGHPQLAMANQVHQVQAPHASAKRCWDATPRPAPTAQMA